MKIKLTTIIVLMFIGFLGFSQTSNFEGIIVYKRTTDDGKVAFETYYFGNKKLRIDSDYIFDDGIKSYISIFDFDRNTKVYFENSDEKIKEKNLSGKSSIESYAIDSSLTKQVLGYDCIALVVSFKEGYYSTKQDQVKFLADSLIYETPCESCLEWTMINHVDNRIALHLDETIISDTAGIYVAGGYKREAISITPMKLPDSIFEAMDD